MTILRLDLQAGGWRAVPPRLFEDERLSLDARGVAGYISTRSDSFCLSVSGLCVLLLLGEDKWRRISGELTRAGYLKRIEGKDKRGRFRHELLFSPIPDGGFPEKHSRRPSTPSPKTQGQPGSAKAGPAQPRAADAGATRELVDLISEDHHQQRPGGGALEVHDSEPPQEWIEAANYEISIEQQARPIRNRGGLLKSIIDRYRANGGPDDVVIGVLKAKKVADVAREASAEAAREQARQESERVYAEAQRHAEAEAKAIAISSEERLNLFLIAEGTVPIRASKIARDAFVERGEILRGPLCRALVQSLMSL